MSDFVIRKPELLIPAGGGKQFISAVENGADAVYIGGELFNARMNAANFGAEEIIEAIGFAHKRNVSVHVTMNTLVRDDELHRALRYAEFLYEIGADALIVQDLGLAKLISTSMPDIPLHLSTQGTVYDVNGVKAAKKLGFSRVVLARETPLEEIRKIRSDVPDMELETFIHGALCICWSGQCQLSRYFGGRSGNRGECAQPCRLPYLTIGNDRPVLNAARHPLSPKDLCLIDRLPELMEAGVRSFKVEGRMKSPEYVAVVTKIYRKYIDMCFETGIAEISDEDREALAQIYSRGGFTEGYIDGKPAKDLMSGDIPKHQGIKVGAVARANGNDTLIDAKLNKPLEMGDGFEIHSSQLTGGIISYKKPIGSSTYRIGDVKTPVRIGNPIYRTSSKEQLEQARRTFENLTYTEGRFTRKLPIALTMNELPGGKLTLSAAVIVNEIQTGTGDPLQYIIVASEEAGPFEPDPGAYPKRERAANSLIKTGNTPFEVAELHINGSLELDVKAADFNELRRRTIASLERKMSEGRDKPAMRPDAVIRVNAAPDSREREEIVFYNYRDLRDWLDSMLLGTAEGDDAPVTPTIVLPLFEFMEHRTELEGLDVIPSVSNITQGAEDKFITSRFEEIVSVVRKTGIYIGNLNWVTPFANAGCRVYADSGLNVFNKATETALTSLSVLGTAPSLEAADISQGAYPLMVMRHSPVGDVIVRKGGSSLKLVKPEWSSQTFLMPTDAPPYFTRTAKVFHD